MNIRYLLLVFICTSTNIFSQVEYLHEATGLKFDDLKHREINGDLYELGNNILVVDSTLNFVNSKGNAGQDRMFDSDNNIITLSSTNTPGDIILLDHQVVLQKFNANLEKIDEFYSEVFPIIAPHDFNSTTKLVELTDSTILIFVHDRRIVFNHSTFEIDKVSEDVILGNLDRIGWIDNNRILIQEIGSTDYYIADSTGGVTDTINMNINRDWIWYQDFIWATEGMNIVKRNAQFEIVESYSFDNELHYFKLGPDDQLIIGASHSIIEFANANSEPEVIFESNYSEEIIKHGFYFRNKLFLQGYEIKELNTDWIRVSTTRIADPLDFEKLPDIGIETEKIEFNIMEVTSSYTFLNLIVSIEIENKGSHPIHSAAYVIDGNCSGPPQYPGFCGRGDINGLNILSGEKSTVEISTYDWFITDNSNSSIEMEVSFYNPNDQYDRNYVDNNIQWKTDFTNTKNPLAQTAIKVFPNPTADQIHLELDPDIKFSTLEIYNNMGQRVATKEVEINTIRKTVDVSNLVSGRYTILLNGENAIHRSTFIKL